MKQIIAMGGGGFSMEPDNPLLDQYVIQQSGKKNPKICFLPTASAENPDYTANFYSAFKKFECQPGHLLLFNQNQKDLRAYLLQFDIIYVGGGNTRCMLALWREWKLDSILKTAWENGIVIAGISAGAICWFEQGITDSVAGELNVMDCLGWLAGSCCPHYDSEAERRPTYHRLVGDGTCRPGFALEDGAAVHFIDGSLKTIVSSRPGAKAYWLEKTGEETQEKPLPIHYLGS